MAEWVTSSFVPFDDSLSRPAKVNRTADPSNPPADTRPYERFRQGVELREYRHLYGSTQSKFWGGRVKEDLTISHELEPQNFGAPVSFTEFYGTTTWKETQKFDPIRYILEGPEAYPYPLIFNEGPQGQEVCSIESFDIPFKKDETAAKMLADLRVPRASLDDGNALDGRTAPTNGLRTGNSKVEQFVETTQPLVVRPFLDSDGGTYGNTPQGSVHLPGRVLTTQRLITPYKDRDTDDELITQTSASTGLKAALRNLDGFKTDKSSTIAPNGYKSTTAGSDVYGPKQARYGTDSIAFVGRIRGS